ncbi:hypothetical protein ARMSODRAFT_1023587 [Armillaria solidipes]|uniref:Protein kinase domain-containing protein n=1 Tax=Armillaria solidipes TaxID=1076256 RepID=A0A2H3BJB7_9AGAR|nr:hypothetical protein ARMSODRAFT_1023587 [Armillaria solidipes]
MSGLETLLGFPPRPQTMDTPCPANIQELLTYFPARPQLHPEAIYSTSTAAYCPRSFFPPEKRPLCCRPYPELLLELKKFIGGVVNDLGIGGVSCQSMQRDLQRMSDMYLWTEAEVSLHGGHVISAVELVVQAISEAASLPGRTNVLHESAVHSWQRDDFNITVQRKWLEDGHVRKQRILVCSEGDKAYSVLLSKAEDFSRSLRLDATKEQTGAKAMAVRLALQMANAGADYGFFFGGFIAIAAQLVHSIDPSHPGTILLLSPAFKLQNETLPDLHRLTPFQANIPTEPFLAIVVAILCSNIFPQHSIKSPPRDLCLPLTIPDEDAAKNEVGDNEENTSGESDIPIIALQVATNAMILQHPWLRSSDIHRISVHLNSENIPTASRHLLRRESFMHLCRCAPRIPSTTVDTVTLVDEIVVSLWSSVWRCRVEVDDKLRIMKLVPRLHSAMVLRELYIYEVALKDCSLVPVCYGVFQRPAGGWFGFLLEDVGDTLEETYGMSWRDVKRGVSATEWQKLVNSVIELHSLGVVHGDLEPRNVARTVDGFKFFDFGRSRLHLCQRDQCGELQNLLDDPDDV